MNEQHGDEQRPIHEEQDGVVVFWRPGCGFCVRLRSALKGREDEVTWVNVWEDEEASAFVRSVNRGNEVVPTVLIDGEPHTNPAPATVLARLERA